MSFFFVFIIILFHAKKLYIIITSILREFFLPALADGFHLSLSDHMYPQVSRTFLSILVDPNNATLWIISTFPPISMSSDPFINPPLITIRISFTFMFHSFF